MNYQEILGYVILFAILFIMYAGIRHKSLSEAWEEVKDLFRSGKDKVKDEVIGIGELKKK